MKQTVTSKYEPKSKNVTWIDMSTGSPVQKNFINGMLRPTGGSGGGASSSNPTEADATKVWQVTPVQKGTKTEETVIVPEQTLENEQELPYNDKFVPGAQCVAVINGVEYRGEVYEYEMDPIVYYVVIYGESDVFVYDSVNDIFKFETTKSSEVTVKLSVIEEVPIYDYNWAPGVKIPIPTAEDEGKILVVTKVEGNNTSIIVPEQPVPADAETPLTDVDLTKFVVGNTVKVTVTYGEEQSGEFNGSGTRGAKSANSETFTATEVVVESADGAYVVFNIDGDSFTVSQEDNLFYTNACDVVEPNSTIKLEYIEPNYEYQLQENSSGSSDVLWPALHKNEFGDEIMATFVSEDVKPNTWCMVCGTNGSSQPVCYPVLINEYDDYTLYSSVSGVTILKITTFDGVGTLLKIQNNIA